MLKWLFKLRLGPELASASPLNSSFREKKKEIKNVKTNIPTNTPLIFLNLENRNILIVLHTKIPKPNDKMYIQLSKCNKRMKLHQKQYPYR